MGVSKVVYDGQTLVDLTTDSVTPDALLEGVTAHGADGEIIVGTLPLSGLNYVISLENGVADRSEQEINGAYADGRLLIVRKEGKYYFLQSYDLDSGYCFLNISKSITVENVTTEFLYYKNDLTQDTVIADKLLAGYKAHGADGEEIVGSCDYDANTQDATAADSEILEGKTAYVKGTKKIGIMPNNGAVSGTITTKEGTYTVPQGYHDGAGKVGIDANEKTKLIAENIREGVSILGVEGTDERY